MHSHLKTYLRNLALKVSTIKKLFALKMQEHILYISLCHSYSVLKDIPGQANKIPDIYCTDAEKARQSLSKLYSCEVILPAREVADDVKIGQSGIVVNGLSISEHVKAIPSKCNE